MLQIPAMAALANGGNGLWPKVSVWEETRAPVEILTSEGEGFDSAMVSGVSSSLIFGGAAGIPMAA